MSVIDFYGDVRWDGSFSFFSSDVPYIFNFEYAVETENAAPAINKIIITGSGDLKAWPRLPLAVNLANNHILDLGDEGFLHTVEVLDQYDVAWFGVGTAEDNFHNPRIIEMGDKRIALLGYSDCEFLLEMTEYRNVCARPTEQQISSDMAACRDADADRIIVNIHWGREERSWYNKRQELLGHMFIDAGADLVIGHHPHCIQPVECYREKYIFYSLGNSFFPDLDVPSYYNAQGQSEFNACVRSLRCGRRSLRVRYDISQNTVVGITRMKYKKGVVVEQKSLRGIRAVPEVFRITLVNEGIGYFRRFLILIRSNVQIRRRPIFNGKAFKKEFDFLFARKKKENT